MNRRSFSRFAASLGVTALLGAAREGASKEVGGTSSAAGALSTPQNLEELEAQHMAMMSKYGSFMAGPKLTIGMVVYPGMFLMDLIGPLTVFESLMNREIYLIWKDLKPVNNTHSDYAAYIPIQPTTTFKNCPTDLDVLFVPGGVPATMEMMQDQELIAFLAEQGKTARYITSVCTGSLILGAAGLLQGYRATSHWMTMAALPELGAIPVQERVVIDRNRITGGGVTAGIDFGLTLIRILRNKDYAQAVQLYLEYDPAPPFRAGSPKTAPTKVRNFVFDMMRASQEHAIAIAKKVYKKPRA